MPEPLTIVAAVLLVVALMSAVVVLVDVVRGPQHMGVMNLVWPITALYGGLIGLAVYFRLGRETTRGAMRRLKSEGRPMPAKTRPFWQTAALATTHCGAGCTLADILGEWLLFFWPMSLFGHRLFAAWVVDFVLAYIFGVAFQYFTIVPMRKLSPAQGLAAALKADSLSLAAWQVGMYGFMALMVFVVFGAEIPKTSPVFWFLMQLAMLAGFLTSYPINWWLLRAGIKEPM